MRTMYRLRTRLRFLHIPLLLTKLYLRAFSYRSLSQILLVLSPPPKQIQELAPISSRVTVLTRRVEYAARHSPFYVSCLERSLVLWWLLRWIRQPSDLQIGIRLDPERGFQAHAWLEQNGQVLNDRPDIASEYLPFDDQVAPEQISRLVS